jgi:hypothetical protein
LGKLIVAFLFYAPFLPLVKFNGAGSIIFMKKVGYLKLILLWEKLILPLL